MSEQAKPRNPAKVLNSLKEAKKTKIKTQVLSGIEQMKIDMMIEKVCPHYFISIRQSLLFEVSRPALSRARYVNAYFDREEKFEKQKATA